MQLLFTHDNTPYGKYYLQELERAFKRTRLQTLPLMPFVVAGDKDRVVNNLPPKTRIAIVVDCTESFQVRVSPHETTATLSYISCPLFPGVNSAFNGFRAVLRYLEKQGWSTADVVIVPPLGGVSHTLAHELHRAFSSVVPNSLTRKK
jgi:hypothetical protein